MHIDIPFLRKQLYIGLVMAVAVVSFHAVANELSWYWIFKGLDTPMHILGGLMSGYFMLLLWFLYKRYQVLKKKGYTFLQTLHRSSDEGGKVKVRVNVVGAAIVGVIIVGVVWELLEYAYGLSGLGVAQRFDTIKDIINDMIGGVIAALLWDLSLIKSRTRSTEHTK